MATLLYSTLILWSSIIGLGLVSGGCLPSYTEIRGGCFLAIKDAQGDFLAARKLCQNFNGDLAIVDDCALLGDLAAYLASPGVNISNVWIGGTDVASEGTWRWTDGTAIPMGAPFWGRQFFPEFTIEPSGGVDENCAAMSVDAGYYFQDVDCDLSSGYAPLCQFSPLDAHSTTLVPQMSSKATFLKLTPRDLELHKLFTGRDKISKVAPEGWTYPSAIEKYMEDFKAFEFEEGDVTVMTFPKSGTTWSQEIVWNMRLNPNLDNPAATTALNIRSPSLGVDVIIDHVPTKNHSFAAMFSQLFPDFDQSHGMFIHVIKMTPRPRVIKTHTPFTMLSPTVLEKGKVVYVIRDPRDVCISYHHHCHLLKYENFEGTFDQFIDAFMEDAVMYGPYWSHIANAWKHRNHPNMYITYYEKLKKNPKAEITKLNEFMGTKLTEKQIEGIVKYTSFAEMKKRDNHVVAAIDAPHFMNMALVESDGGFFRQGVSGGWKTALNQEQKDKFEAWIKKNCPDQEIMNNILNP